jgi:hypothetical protein
MKPISLEPYETGFLTSSASYYINAQANCQQDLPLLIAAESSCTPLYALSRLINLQNRLVSPSLVFSW